MSQILLRLVFLLFCVSASSQNITLNGSVTDGKSDAPLESATVYITRETDSTMVDYTITDKFGAFSIITRKSDKATVLKVSYMGYNDHSERLTAIDSDKDFGAIKIFANNNALDEVIIKTEAPPVRIKNDTLEFNAASFKLRPDANVESLLKQLPGVEIDEEGKIKVNGKEVNQILVNGKPFFDKDGKIALQNLPSDIINKVQVTDSKTKAEEISGKAATSDNASINLTIDEDKNKGLFGKATLGYGTDERYEGSLLFNYFKGNRKISILGSSNNVNATGFSMDELFDSMGGGRNYSIWMNDDGGFGINGMMFGGGRGIKRSNIFGANFADVWIKTLDVNSSYFYTGSKAENKNRTRLVNFLSDETQTSESNSESVDDSFAHNFNLQLEYKIDSTSTLTMNPKFVLAERMNRIDFSQKTFDEVNLINETESFDGFEENRKTFENSIYYYKALKRKGRSINVSANHENSASDQNALRISDNRFYNDLDDDGIIDEITEDNRNQTRINRNLNDHYFAELSYQEPVTDSLSFSVSLRYDKTANSDNRRTYDFNAESGDYDLYNDILSMYTESDASRVTPGVGINWNRSKLNINIFAGTEYTNFSARSFYVGENIKLDRKYLFADANFQVSYRIKKSMSLWFSYDFDLDMPQAMQILPVVDLSNPLVSFSGNPNISPTERHYSYLSFRDYDYGTKSGYSIYMGGTYYMNQINTSTAFNSAGQRFTTYLNVDDTYNLWAGGNWSKSIKREAHSFKVTLSMNSSFNRYKGFIDAESYDSRQFSLTPKVNFSYDYGELLTINPVYRFTYSETDYSNYVIDRASNVLHTFTLQTTSYWPKHVVLGNDISYTYNSNIADGFKKDFYLWNISLGYNFFKDKLLAKVKVYDLLDQNQSATRSITATSIRDEENIVLRRYAMFSLTYKLEKFGKKKEERGFWHMD